MLLIASLPRQVGRSLLALQRLQASLAYPVSGANQARIKGRRDRSSPAPHLFRHSQFSSDARSPQCSPSL